MLHSLASKFIVLSIGVIPLFAHITCAAMEQPDHTMRAAASMLAAYSDLAHPGVAVLVAKGEKILFEEAVGSANIALRVPLSTDSVFRIGSISKQFTAAAVMKLVEAGKLSLDEPVSKFLPDFPHGSNIKVRYLLNHTSGIKNYYEIPGYLQSDVRRSEMTLVQLMALFKDEPLDFTPGSDFHYTNSGYVVLAAIIERVTGQAWSTYLEHALFEPLGLRHTKYASDREIFLGLVTGYGYSDAGVLRHAAPNSVSQTAGGGALVSTVEDLWHWTRALHTGKMVSQDSYALMTLPSGAAKTKSVDYGFGLEHAMLEGRDAYCHDGLIFGFSSYVAYVPEYEITVIVLSNSDSGPIQPQDIATKLLHAAIHGIAP